MIAEGDKVVCRVHGIVKGNHGPYNNTYCHVFTLRGDQIVEDIEYLDTLLIERALYGRKLTECARRSFSESARRLQTPRSCRHHGVRQL